MSFHGGLVGIFIAKMDLRKKKTFFMEIGGSAQRSHNFRFGFKVGWLISSMVSWYTAFGKENGVWYFRIIPQCRHPNMIHSFFQRMIVFGWLFLLTFWKEFKPSQVAGASDRIFTSFRSGFIFWNFVFWEGLGRIIVDFYREDALYLGLSLGQWFSSIMVVAKSNRIY